MKSIKGSSGPTRRDVLRLPAAAVALSATRSFGLSETIQYAPLRDIPFPDSPDLEKRAFERVTFEMSPKPFRSMAENDVRSVCQEMYRQWGALIRRTDTVAVMLWTADGSEILDYRGNKNDEVEWARHIGIGSPPKDAPGDDPRRVGLHSVSHLYMENPPRMTYSTLQMIVRTLKEVGHEMTGKPVFVGATFDPGPEFANSKFKYVRHPEIAKGDTHGRDTWVSCVARLHADNVAYAAFPRGITEGMSIGTFLGGQAQRFLTDMGFDYLWLSNGFGFSISSWDVKGPLFDGKEFNVSKAPVLRDSIIQFWKDFREKCPKFPLETRGTNLPLGSDMATSACPLQEIYDGGFNMIAPPNSPWAALDGDFGLELVGYLSRIAELPPNGKYPFRYYTHDPWWLNSPWFDRYGREPHDIYLPLALARVDAKANITKPASLNVLTVDNSYGRMPEQCPNEVTPHLLSAMDSFSDAPGLLTWLCPFREYHEMVFGPNPQPQIPFFADWFLRGAVNSGLPLNTVVSTGNYLSAAKKAPHYFNETVLMSLLPAPDSELEASLIHRIEQGRPVLFYGPANNASPALLSILGLRITSGIEERVELKTVMPLDVNQLGNSPMTVRHRSILCGGPVDTIAAGEKEEVLATVSQNATERVYAVKKGSAAWIRGTFASSIGDGGARIPIPDNPRDTFVAESLTRAVLAQFGYSIRIAKPTAATRLPVILAARCRNGYFISGYSPSTTASIQVRFPFGAPLLLGRETWIEKGHTAYTMPRAWHCEARCFVDQAEASELSCSEYFAGMVGFRRRMLITGLKNATVTFLPEDDQRVVMQVNDMRLHIQESSVPILKSTDGRRLTVRDVTGTLFLSW